MGMFQFPPFAFVQTTGTARAAGPASRIRTATSGENRSPRNRFIPSANFDLQTWMLIGFIKCKLSPVVGQSVLLSWEIRGYALAAVCAERKVKPMWGFIHRFSWAEDWQTDNMSQSPTLAGVQHLYGIGSKFQRVVQTEEP